MAGEILVDPVTLKKKKSFRKLLIPIVAALLGGGDRLGVYYVASSDQSGDHDSH